MAVRPENASEPPHLSPTHNSAASHSVRIDRVAIGRTYRPDEAGEGAALELFARWGGQPLPLSASAWHGGVLWDDDAHLTNFYLMLAVGGAVSGVTARAALALGVLLRT